MIQVNSKLIHCCDWFVNDSAKAKCKAESTTKQKNRQYQGLFTYAFVLHSTGKTFWKAKIYKTQQFWVERKSSYSYLFLMHSKVKQWNISGFALSKGSHQQPNTSAVVENMLRGLVLSLLLQGRLVLRVPLAVQELERRGTTEIPHYICASIAPTYGIISPSFSYSVDHVTEVVWIILQGNGNYVGEQSQDHKSQSSWKSNRSACPRPLHALCFLAAAWDICQGLESQQAGVTHPPTCREVKAHSPSHLYLWKILAGNVVILTY